MEQLLSGSYTSHVRNKKIAAIFKEAGIIEQYGSGISRIIKAFNDYGLATPAFENFQHGFRVTVFSKKADVVENVVEKRAIEENILKTIKQNRRISASDIAKHLGVSGRNAQRYIRKLQDGNVIRRIGSDKGGYWEETKR